MGAYRVGHGELVSAVGRLWPTHAGDGGNPDRPGRGPCAAAAGLSHRWVEGLHGGTLASLWGPLSAAASGQGGPQAQTAAGSPQRPVLCPGGQGPQQDGSGRRGQQARGVRRPAPFWEAVAPAAARCHDPNSLYGTVVWDTPRLGGPATAPHPVPIVEPLPPPGEGLAHGQPLQLCDAAQEPAPRPYIAHTSDGHWPNRPCVELS